MLCERTLLLRLAKGEISTSYLQSFISPAVMTPVHKERLSFFQFWCTNRHCK